MRLSSRVNVGRRESAIGVVRWLVTLALGGWLAACGSSTNEGADLGVSGCVALQPAICNGLCVDISSNRQHCGACDQPCAAPGVCSGGKCKVTCARGTNFCESDRSCSNLLSDVNHCGRCEVACDGGTCADGGCVPGCRDTQLACGGVCIDPKSDPANCGGCGAACPQGQACVEGVCGLGCLPGLTNCNGQCVDLYSDAANCGRCGGVCPKMPVTDGGVAMPLCSNDQCAMSCGQGTVNCPAGCVNLLADPRNCGGCGVVCPGGAVCSLGTCASGCGTGLTRCGRSCVNLLNDPGQCGACGSVCRLDQVCSRGACVANCGPGEVLCNGVCVDLATDTGHCGGCGTVCTGGQVCVGGVCSNACPANFTPCGTTCRDTRNDPSQCGACGVVCRAIDHGQPSCLAGACVAVCDAGFGDCNGRYLDGCESVLGSDALHCGACGSGCALANAVSKCVASACTIGSCLPGWLDCNQSAKDGCEIAANDDPKNCGKCGLACPSAPSAKGVCNGGACDVSCDPDRGNCDGKPANGCEVSLGTDPANCGACGVACPAVTNGTAGCTDGQCVVAACAGGFADCDGVAKNGCEVNLNTDVNRCGSCGRACPKVPSGVPGCTAGACGVGSCVPGFADCDKDPTNGCEVNLGTNSENCGACANACAPLANGFAQCAGGNCTLGGCTTGFRNCDNVANNGCEVDIRNDPKNCGVCGNACPPGGNGQLTCFNGSCAVSNCNPFFADCNNKALDGCEVDLKTLNNCGGCGAVCNFPNSTDTCASGQCQIQSCLAGWGNCDNNPANGCEKSVLSDVNNCGGCLARCGAGQGCCGGQCLDLLADPTNCGACGNVCANGLKCLLGSCCAPGNLNCGSGCVDPNTSSANCGGCGKACGNGLSCTNAICCPTGQTSCSGQCRDTRVDPLNCGTCGRVCNLGKPEVCLGGLCCNAGLLNCGGACVDPNFNPSHCGGCGRGCANGQICLLGQCCAGGSVLCPVNGVLVCTDVRSNKSNCGACGKVCAEGCCSGQCTALSLDPGNCGSCGTTCAMGSLCSSGRCCPLGQTNCSGVCRDTSTDASNCGGCGNVCAGGTTCCDGGCVDLKSDARNCGACGKSCAGNAAGVRCISGRCGCTNFFECPGLRACDQGTQTCK